ncbi:signal peptidase I [Rhodococcus sp. D2-41]|uniref:Signal peptidase I n=1 Tax=Speluncibacter jeojiensis TaxID=2710754 RepID=A0A9X4M5H0_9ACTN|nr:signal peptidase I [Rhodococcus sp. D2-41]MDG3011102.1 signal peptidase I [Rhodococcus sp. D2-41]MDG3017222.1 signal peptidase I [Corynebacteriales bacterium D3-21]
MTGEAGASRNRRLARRLREVGILVVVAIALSVLLQTFVARIYLIPSQSMETTLHGCPGCTGDRIVVDKLTYRFGNPRPGDVVVFKGPPSWDEPHATNRSPNTFVRGLQNLGSFVGLVPPDEFDLVKRVIAIGGQTVRCLPGDKGVVVDGKLLDEPYRKNPPSPLPGAESPCQGPYFGPVHVPPGHVWVMGDNRTNSQDSRYHMGDVNSGCVAASDIIGKARWIVLPLSRIGSIPSPDPQS